jgi:hypothetical protein
MLRPVGVAMHDRSRWQKAIIEAGAPSTSRSLDAVFRIEHDSHPQACRAHNHMSADDPAMSAAVQPRDWPAHQVEN